MGSGYTAYVSKDFIERAAPLLSSGEFENQSELLRFAIRTFWDWIERDNVESLQHIIRGELIKRNVQVNDYVMERITATGLVDKPEIADYALDHYLRMKGL